MKKVFLIITACMLSLFANAQDEVVAQSSLDGFEAHIGVTFPSGDFGDEDEGGAATGLNLGVKYYFPLKTQGLSLFAGLDVFYNGLQGDIKGDLEDAYNDEADITFSSFLNIPIMVGANYSHPINEKIRLFGEIGLGLNYSKITSEKIEMDDYEYSEETSFDPSTQFAYNIGGGIFINDKYSLSLRYNNLGKHKYKYKYTEEYQGQKDKDTGKTKGMSISSIALVFGIKF